MTPEKKPRTGSITKLQAGKPLVRETAVYERTRPLIVELHPKFLKIRPKGQHGGAAPRSRC